MTEHPLVVTLINSHHPPSTNNKAAAKKKGEVLYLDGRWTQVQTCPCNKQGANVDTDTKEVGSNCTHSKHVPKRRKLCMC
jgi:hypothetical protein